MIYWILFFLACSVLLVLPMLPALLEWRYPQDAQPLKVVRAYDGNIKYFAHSFRHFLAEHYPGLIPAAAILAPAEPARTAWPAQADVQLVADGAGVCLSALALAERSCAQLLLSPGRLTLEHDMLYEKELYAGAQLFAGQRNTFRAILALGDISLGEECAVLRWAHSDGSIAIGSGARLYGRLSAECAIALGANCRFGRMWAPVIRFGAAPDPAPERAAGAAGAAAAAPLARPSDLIDATPWRWLVAGTLEVPPASSHQGALVAGGDVRIGAGARLHGDIKSNGDLTIGAAVHIDGSLVATGTISVGRDCRIKGPVVCDRVVILDGGSVIGAPDCPTTVTAAEIHVTEGVTVHGTVWARELGFVAAAQAGAA